MNTHGLIISSNRNLGRLGEHCQSNLAEGACLFIDCCVVRTNEKLTTKLHIYIYILLRSRQWLAQPDTLELELEFRSDYNRGFPAPQQLDSCFLTLCNPGWVKAAAKFRSKIGLCLLTNLLCAWVLSCRRTKGEKNDKLADEDICYFCLLPFWGQF